MVKKGSKVSIEKLLVEYDQARSVAKEAKDRVEELNTEIKTTLGETEEVDTPEYLCTYYFDKDKEVESFDEEGFATKNPKQYGDYQQHLADAARLAKKFTKTTTVKGARKLLVVRKNEEEA